MLVSQVWPKVYKTVGGNHRDFGDIFFVDEAFIRIGDKQHYLWRAVDQEGEVVDVLLQTRRNTAAAMYFFKKDNETPRCKQRGSIYFASKIYSVASHGEFNPRTRLKSAGGSPHMIVTD